MVRLKDANDMVNLQVDPEFQFHNGSIKSVMIPPVIHRYATFQFHNGSIKSSFQKATVDAQTSFQFHNGSIKRQPTTA